MYEIPLSFDFSSCAQIIVAVFGNVQDLAHAKNRKQVAMFIDKLEFYGWGCAKMLTAFFKISLSCCNISISRLSFLFSSSIAV